MRISLRVKDVMDDKIYMVDESTTCRDALKTMVEKGVWSLLVSREGLPVGVVTERDIIKKVIAKGMNLDGVRVAEIMSSPIITVAPDEPVARAMELMAVNDIRRVYVVDEGRVIGRVTQTTLFKKVLDLLMLLSDLTWYM
ncbi:MAG TPA: CBS domain-containing protein [Thermoprotei archaeon]|nr:CBS domain-containing protein [Thermoprotei archaeon]